MLPYHFPLNVFPFPFHSESPLIPLFACHTLRYIIHVTFSPQNWITNEGNSLCCSFYLSCVPPPLLCSDPWEAPCSAQSLVHKWFGHLWLMAQSDQNRCSNRLTSSYSWCQCWEHVSCAVLPTNPPYLQYSHFLIGLSSFAEPYTCLAAGSQKVRSTGKLKDMPCWEHMAQWNTRFPCLPCCYNSFIWVFLSRTQCASQFMPDQHAMFPRQTKTPLFSQKPGKTLPSRAPCTAETEGACRVTWCLPTGLNAKWHWPLFPADYSLTEMVYWLREQACRNDEHKRR